MGWMFVMSSKNNSGGRQCSTVVDLLFQSDHGRWWCTRAEYWTSQYGCGYWCHCCTNPEGSTGPGDDITPLSPIEELSSYLQSKSTNNTPPTKRPHKKRQCISNANKKRLFVGNDAKKRQCIDSKSNKRQCMDKTTKPIVPFSNCNHLTGVRPKSDRCQNQILQKNIFPISGLSKI